MGLFGFRKNYYVILKETLNRRIVKAGSEQLYLKKLINIVRIFILKILNYGRRLVKFLNYQNTPGRF